MPQALITKRELCHDIALQLSAISLYSSSEHTYTFASKIHSLECAAAGVQQSFLLSMSKCRTTGCQEHKGCQQGPPAASLALTL